MRKTTDKRPHHPAPTARMAQRSARKESIQYKSPGFLSRAILKSLSLARSLARQVKPIRGGGLIGSIKALFGHARAGPCIRKMRNDSCPFFRSRAILLMTGHFCSLARGITGKDWCSLFELKRDYTRAAGALFLRAPASIQVIRGFRAVLVGIFFFVAGEMRGVDLVRGSRGSDGSGRMRSEWFGSCIDMHRWEWLRDFGGAFSESQRSWVFLISH